jgi:hypothetical protein
MSFEQQQQQDKQQQDKQQHSSLNEENKCVLCLNDLNNKKNGLKKIIHKCDKEVCEWQHSFHISCINGWINACLNTEEGKYPKCPTCNKFDIPLEKIPEKLRLKAQTIWERDFYQNVVQEAAEENEEAAEAMRRLLTITSRNEIHNLPFIACILVVNGEVIGQVMNFHLGITIRHTLGDLKNAILNHNSLISQKLGLFNPVKFRLKYWTNSEYPTYRVVNMRYGIPPYTCQFEQLESICDLNNDDTLLSDIYLDYQHKAGAIIRNGSEHINSEDAPQAYYEVEQVYNRQKLYWNGSTGPDDPGYYDLAFLNEQNSIIPIEYRAYEYRMFSTLDSISWLVINLIAEDM